MKIKAKVTTKHESIDRTSPTGKVQWEETKEGWIIGLGVKEDCAFANFVTTEGRLIEAWVNHITVDMNEFEAN